MCSYGILRVFFEGQLNAKWTLAFKQQLLVVVKVYVHVRMSESSVAEERDLSHSRTQLPPSSKACLQSVRRKQDPNRKQHNYFNSVAKYQRLRTQWGNVLQETHHTTTTYIVCQICLFGEHINRVWAHAIQGSTCVCMYVPCIKGNT